MTTLLITYQTQIGKIDTYLHQSKSSFPVESRRIMRQGVTVTFDPPVIITPGAILRIEERQNNQK